MEPRGRVVLVTGASSGIGAATASAFGREGATVLLVARSADALEAVADEILDRGGRAVAYPTDLSDPDAVAELATTVREAYGTPDVLVNVAGAGRFLSTEETEPGEVVEMMAVPYFAAFYVTRAFLPEMLERGEGRIVNLTSAAAYAPWPGSTAYAAARWAMRGFTEALRADLYGTGVGVTLVASTTVASPYWEHNPGSQVRLPAISRLFPTLSPEDVAASIVDAVREERRTVLLPRRFRLVAALHRVFPGPVEWLVATTSWRRASA